MEIAHCILMTFTIIRFELMTDTFSSLIGFSRAATHFFFLKWSELIGFRPTRPLNCTAEHDGLQHDVKYDVREVLIFAAEIEPIWTSVGIYCVACIFRLKWTLWRIDQFPFWMKRGKIFFAEITEQWIVFLELLNWS